MKPAQFDAYFRVTLPVILVVRRSIVGHVLICTATYAPPSRVLVELSACLISARFSCIEKWSRLQLLTPKLLNGDALCTVKHRRRRRGAHGFYFMSRSLHTYLADTGGCSTCVSLPYRPLRHERQAGAASLDGERHHTKRPVNQFRLLPARLCIR